MAQQLGGPEARTVIAIDLKPRAGGVSSEASQADFAGLLGGTVAQACMVQPALRPDGELAYTAIVPETGQTLSVLRRLLSIQNEFRQKHPEIAARFVVHHGLIFAAPTAGNRQFLGSAVRSAHSHLQRLPEPLECAVTQDFAAVTEAWDNCPISFHVESAGGGNHDLLTFALPTEHWADTVEDTQDVALQQYLVESLAAYLGPFAEILVESAQRSARSPFSLIEEVSHEINDMPARERFKVDAMNYLAKRSTG